MSGFPEGVYEIWTPWVSSHLLVDGGHCVLIDTGFSGIIPRLQGLLQLLGLSWSNIDAILLTHGHLGHTANLAEIKELSGALVYGMRIEQMHINGSYPYKGLRRLWGGVEQHIRSMMNYEPALIDVYIEQGDRLSLWKGLTAIHLPGHTRGHCGFYCQKEDLLFSGDLFMALGSLGVSSPGLLNTVPWFMADSMNRVRELNPALIVANHYYASSPQKMRKAFDFFYKHNYRKFQSITDAFEKAS